MILQSECGGEPASFSCVYERYASVWGLTEDKMGQEWLQFFAQDDTSMSRNSGCEGTKPFSQAVRSAEGD